MVTFQLPAGPKNLQPLFSDVDFNAVDEYYLVLRDLSDSSIIATTNKYKRGCCCNSDTVSLFYVNYLGGVDSIILKIISEDTDVRSSRWKKSLLHPLKKFDGGTQRFNITSNETIKGENFCFAEEDQEYLKELIATPNAWIHWKGTQGQDDNYIPVVINDGKFVTRKENERYAYVLQVELEMANENIVLR